MAVRFKDDGYMGPYIKINAVGDVGPLYMATKEIRDEYAIAQRVARSQGGSPELAATLLYENNLPVDLLDKYSSEQIDIGCACGTWA